jgi:N-acyl-D-amino-acid deacylase
MIPAVEEPAPVPRAATPSDRAAAGGGGPTEPAATTAPASATQPVATPPVVSQPVATRPVVSQPAAKQGLPSFDAAMTSVLAQGYPGGSLAVVRDDKLVYTSGFGSARDGVPATPTTRYRQASVSKAVTRSLLAKLVASGTLSLGLRVFPFLGVAPADPRANAITVGMLRDHTSGLGGDYVLLEARQAATFYGVASPPGVDPMIRWTAHYPLASDPGSQYRYNNTNYAILSRVMEKATGRTWIDLANEMTGPVGIRSWRMEASLANPVDEARYYEVEKYRFMPSVFDGVPGSVEAAYGGYDGASLAGATALVSTVIDMARYAQGVSVGAIQAPEPQPIPTKPGSLYTYVYNGSMPGHYTFVMRIWDGTHLTVLAGAFNHRDAGPIDETINGRMLDAYRATQTWPTLDLFPNY